MTNMDQAHTDSARDDAATLRAAAEVLRRRTPRKHAFVREFTARTMQHFLDKLAGQLAESDSVTVLLSPGSVHCAADECRWSKTSGSQADQMQALVDHTRTEHSAERPPA
jgi:hypothetical protein